MGPAITLLASQGVEIAGSYGTDNDPFGTSIQGQRLGFPVFADGFESGDVSVWSGVVP